MALAWHGILPPAPAHSPKQGAARADDDGLRQAVLPSPLREADDDGDEGAEVGADVEAGAQGPEVVLPRVGVHEVEPRDGLARDHLQQQQGNIDIL